MASNLDRFKKDLVDLQHRGMLLECAMVRDVKGEGKLREVMGKISDEEFSSTLKKLPKFKVAYEIWYSECIALIKHVLPDRLEAFIRQYERAKNRKDISYDNYVIEDYMLGLRVTFGGDLRVDVSAAIPKMQNQTAILAAAAARFSSSLFDIRQIVQAELFDSEIDSARELLKKKFLRAAGAVAGVVLEKHLLQVCDNHGIRITKKNAGIGDLNQALKENGAIQVPEWRHISLLGDIRNICDHNKQIEPTVMQVQDLVDGVDKILRTVS